MGQTSLKYLNRVGYNLHWDKIWESQNNYNNTFIKYFFIDIFFNSFFRNNFFKKHNVLKKYYNKFFKTNSYIFFNKFLFVQKPMWYLTNFNFFQSNLWVLSYQNWVILHTYIYVPNILKKKNNENFFHKMKLQNQSNFLYHDFI